MSVLDRTKVIKGLGEALTLLAEYVPGERYLGYAPGACLDAIELLKAQEPVEPTEPDEDNTRYCGACGSQVGYEVLEPQGLGYIQYNYCPVCGKAVKWE